MSLSVSVSYTHLDVYKRQPFNPLLPEGDSTVIRRIIITLKRGGVSPIVVITGDKADEIEKHISNLQVICLRNEQYDKVQMFFSICMGLNYIEDLCDLSLIHIFPMFEEANPGVIVKGTYDSSGKLQTQIEEGLDADVFMSAATKQMKALDCLLYTSKWIKMFFLSIPQIFLWEYMDFKKRYIL